MSLVGNLEDLSLGDIMQIISLSQKFGVLALESDRGAGRIVFSAGLVRGACLKGVEGHYSDLRSLVVGKGVLDPAGFDACESRANDLGLSVEEMLRSEASLEMERLDALVRESVEAAVLEMFTWPSGDFSFDVRNEPDPGDPQLVLRAGLNAQYLAMEGMRRRDETERADSHAAPARKASPPASIDDLSAHAMFGVAEPSDAAEAADEALDEFVLGDDDDASNEFLDEFLAEDLASDITSDIHDDRLESLPGSDDEGETTATNPGAPGVDAGASEAASRPEAAPARAYARPLIVIDPDVAVLEWVKAVLQGEFRQVHVFQRAEQGLMRIRQYLIRGELPVVLISPEAEVDPLSGIRGVGDFVKRLKTQAAKLPVFGLIEAAQQPAPARQGPLDGLLAHPPRRELPNPAAGPDDPAARSLSAALAIHLDA